MCSQAGEQPDLSCFKGLGPGEHSLQDVGWLMLQAAAVSLSALHYSHPDS